MKTGVRYLSKHTLHIMFLKHITRERYREKEKVYVYERAGCKGVTLVASQSHSGLQALDKTGPSFSTSQSYFNSTPLYFTSAPALLADSELLLLDINKLDIRCIGEFLSFKGNVTI